ncbi:MAG: hypothetical protein AAGA75_06440 [Cyanobacteria bacterium P01_E01_bin.6]
MNTSTSIDLTQFCASDVPLTRHQREVLQCLWLMAAIAPQSALECPTSTTATAIPSIHIEAHQQAMVADSSSAWERLLETISSENAVFDVLLVALLEMGFSKATIVNAWQLVLYAKSERNSESDLVSPPDEESDAHES